MGQGGAPSTPKKRAVDDRIRAPCESHLLFWHEACLTSACGGQAPPGRRRKVSAVYWRQYRSGRLSLCGEHSSPVEHCSFHRGGPMRPSKALLVCVVI